MGLTAIRTRTRLLLLLALPALVVGALLMLEGGDTAVAGHGPDCGDTLTTDTTLDSDLGICSGDGLIIGADEITLDCRGHSLTGDGSGDGVKLVGVTGVTVKNCTVIGFRFGFLLNQGSDDNTLKRNTARGNTIGFRLIDSDDNRLKKNTASDSSFGFKLVDAHGNTLKKNTASDTLFGFVLEDSDDNTLEENTARDNDFVGFLIDDNSEDNTLEDNTARGNSIGFELEGSDRNTLEENTARDNAGAGFFVDFSAGNVLLKNEAEENGGDGFFVDSSSGNRFTENEAEDNAGFDCRDATTGTGDFGTDNTWTGNEGETSSPAGLCGDDDNDDDD